MTNERFKELLEELDGNSVKTLAEKNARYSADSGDALHNFKNGAEILGGTPAQACWGYMTKHLVALRDKVERNDFSDKEDFLEKCQDTINYIRFLWCIGNEDHKSDSHVTIKEEKPIEKEPGVYVYECTVYGSVGNLVSYYSEDTKPVVTDNEIYFTVNFINRVQGLTDMDDARMYDWRKYRFNIIK